MIAGPDNFLCQLIGYKELFLVPPSEAERAYYKKNFFNGKISSFDLSAVNPDDPDFVHHPLFSDIKATRVQLGPGDIMYLPAGWGHMTKNRGDVSLMVNFWLTERAGTLAELVTPSSLTARRIYISPEDSQYGADGNPLNNVKIGNNE